MLTGVGPSAETTPPGTSWRLPSQPTRKTENLVAAGVDRQQVAAVTAELERALGSQARTCPRPPGGEGRPRHRREGPVEMAVEGPDRVGPGRVVIEVDVADHRGETGWRVAGDGRGTSRAGDNGAEDASTSERGDAKGKVSYGLIFFRIVFVTSVGSFWEGRLVRPQAALWRRRAHRNDCAAPTAAHGIAVGGTSDLPAPGPRGHGPSSTVPATSASIVV